MNQPDPKPMSVEERVARHLAAKDWLTTEDHWDQGSASFRADYLAHAREVIAIVRAAEPAAQSPADRAALRDRIAEALRPGSRDRSGQYPEGLLRDVDAVLAVFFGSIPSGTDTATWTAIRAVHLMNQAGRERDRYRAAWQSARQRAQAYGDGILRHVADRDFWKAETQRLAGEQPAQNEARPCLHPDGYDGECPCPPSCDCCRPIAEKPPAERAAILLEIATQLDQLAETDVVRKRRSLATARRLLAYELRDQAQQLAAAPPSA